MSLCAEEAYSQEEAQEGVIVVHCMGNSTQLMSASAAMRRYGESRGGVYWPPPEVYQLFTKSSLRMVALSVVDARCLRRWRCREVDIVEIAPRLLEVMKEAQQLVQVRDC